MSASAADESLGLKMQTEEDKPVSHLRGFSIPLYKHTFLFFRTYYYSVVQYAIHYIVSPLALRLRLCLGNPKP